MITILSLFSASRELITSRANCGRSPVHMAASRGGLDIVKMLLERGVDINLPRKGRFNNSMHTPLHRAIACGRDEIVAYLMAHEGIKYGGEEKGSLK